MFTTILLAAMAAIALLLVYAAFRPDNFQVARTAQVNAAPETIFSLINDLHKFNTWNPFEKSDPNLKGSYSGARSGRGAAYDWEGKRAGTGRMEIVDAVAPGRVTMQLNFIKPLKAQNTAEFTLLSQGQTTSVTWAMRGPSPYISKLIGVFFSMDKMIGKAFESGLSDLKALAEAG
jgi:carbon monoxide dehydrogenase subunit G